MVFALSWRLALLSLTLAAGDGTCGGGHCPAASEEYLDLDDVGMLLLRSRRARLETETHSETLGCGSYSGCADDAVTLLAESKIDPKATPATASVAWMAAASPALGMVNDVMTFLIGLLGDETKGKWPKTFAGFEWLGIALAVVSGGFGWGAANTPGGCSDDCLWNKTMAFTKAYVDKAMELQEYRELMKTILGSQKDLQDVWTNIKKYTQGKQKCSWTTSQSKAPIKWQNDTNRGLAGFTLEAAKMLCANIGRDICKSVACQKQPGGTPTLCGVYGHSTLEDNTNFTAYHPDKACFVATNFNLSTAPLAPWDYAYNDRLPGIRDFMTSTLNKDFLASEKLQGYLYPNMTVFTAMYANTLFMLSSTLIQTPGTSSHCKFKREVMVNKIHDVSASVRRAVKRAKELRQEFIVDGPFDYLEQKRPHTKVGYYYGTADNFNSRCYQLTSHYVTYERTGPDVEVEWSFAMKNATAEEDVRKCHIKHRDWLTKRVDEYWQITLDLADRWEKLAADSVKWDLPEECPKPELTPELMAEYKALGIPLPKPSAEGGSSTDPGTAGVLLQVPPAVPEPLTGCQLVLVQSSPTGLTQEFVNPMRKCNRHKRYKHSAAWWKMHLKKFGITVIVKHLHDTKELPMRVRRSSSIAEMKARIEDAWNIPATRQQLFAGSQGQELVNGEDVSVYGLRNGTVVTLNDNGGRYDCGDGMYVTGLDENGTMNSIVWNIKGDWAEGCHKCGMNLWFEQHLIGSGWYCYRTRLHMAIRRCGAPRGTGQLASGSETPALLQLQQAKQRAETTGTKQTSFTVDQDLFMCGMFDGRPVAVGAKNRKPMNSSVIRGDPYQKNPLVLWPMCRTCGKYLEEHGYFVNISFLPTWRCEMTCAEDSRGVFPQSITLTGVLTDSSQSFVRVDTKPALAQAATVEAEELPHDQQLPSWGQDAHWAHRAEYVPPGSKLLTASTSQPANQDVRAYLRPDGRVAATIVAKHGSGEHHTVDLHVGGQVWRLGLKTPSVTTAILDLPLEATAV